MATVALKVGGIVLCGGESRRMGVSKAWLPCGSEVLLQRVVRIVAGVVEPVVVATRKGQSLPLLADDVAVVHDVIKRGGPLAGMSAGFEALAGRCDAAFVASCDQPFLQTPFIEHMIELLEDHPAVVVEHGGYRHPLTAVYRLTTASVLDDTIARGNLRAHDFVESCSARIVSARELADVDPELDSLRNVNDPAAYEDVLRALES